MIEDPEKWDYGKTLDNLCHQLYDDAEDILLLLEKERPNIDLAVILAKKIKNYAENPVEFSE